MLTDNAVDELGNQLLNSYTGKRQTAVEPSTALSDTDVDTLGNSLLEAYSAEIDTFGNDLLRQYEVGDDGQAPQENNDITLDALAENIIADSPVTPLSVVDSAASFLGPGLANFIVGQGGAGLMSAADKVTRDVYTDSPIAPSEIIDRMRGGRHSQAMPDSIIANDSGASPLGAVKQALQNNPVKVDPAKQAEAESYAEHVQNWKNDWMGEWRKQNLTPEEIAARETEAQKYPHIRDFLRYGQPLTEGGRVLSDATIDPLMHKIDTLATAAALKLGDPNDPRDAEFYRSLLFFAGPGAAKGAAKGTLKGAGKVADVAIAVRRQKEFVKRFRENPVDAVNEALPYTDLTPVEGRALLGHVRKTFPESREVVDPIDAAYRRSMPRDRQITEMVEAERSRKLPIEEFEDFFTHRAKLTAEERAGFIERGKQAKTVTELDQMYQEYSASKLQDTPIGKKAELPQTEFNSFFGVPSGIGRRVRKLMQREYKARGPVQPGTESVRALLDSVYWHGRRTLPEWGKDVVKHYDNEMHVPTLESIRMQERNVGEPIGVSLTLDPKIAKQFSYNAIKDKQNNILRVLPRFKTDPTKVVLDTTNRRHQQVLLEAYGHAWEKVVLPAVKQHYPDYFGSTLREFEATRKRYENVASLQHSLYTGEYGNKLIAQGLDVYKQIQEKLKTERDGFFDFEVFYEDLKNISDTVRTDELTNAFNRKLTDKLQRDGWKGVLHSPLRYGEFELQMFNPKDVLILDSRELAIASKSDTAKLPSQYVGKKYVDLSDYQNRSTKAQKQTSTKTTTYTGSLADIYKRFDPISAFRDSLPDFTTTTAHVRDFVERIGELDSRHTTTTYSGDVVSNYTAANSFVKFKPNTFGTMMANIDLMKTIELGARRNQVTIEQYLTQSGMAASRAKQIAGQITNALKRSYDLGMLEPRIIMHNKDPWAAKAEAGIGIVLNDKERQYMRKDNGRLSKTKRVNPAPAVSEQVVREMRDAINPKFKKGGKENLRYYIKNPMQSVIDALGNFGKKRIYEPFLDATAAHNRHKLYIHEHLEQHIKDLKLKPTQLERVGNYAMSIQHNGVARLQAMHEIPLKWADLTLAERIAFDSLAPFYEHMYELANQGRIKSGEAPFQKVQNYTPLMMVHMIAEAAVDNIALWRKETGTLKQNFHKMKKPSWAFKRGTIRKGTYYELNIATQMKKHADSVLWHYYMSPIVAHTHELLSRHNVTGLPDWQQKINQKTGQPAKKTSWSIRKEAPDVYHAIAEYANSIHQRYIKRKIPNRDVSDAMLRLKNNIAFSWLSGNMQTTLNQMGSLVNTLSLSDPVSLIRGVEKAAIPRNWHSALRESRFLRERIGNTTELFNGVADLYGSGGRIRGAYGKFKDTTMIPMQFVDAYNAVVAWHTGKVYGQLYHNLKGMDAIRFADEFTVKTQASNLAVHRPPIMRTDIGSVFTTLQTFHLNQFNVLLDDVFNIRNKVRPIGEKIAQPLLLGLGVAAMNTIYQDGLNTYSPFWSPIQSFCDTMEESDHTADALVSSVIELFQAVPFVSSGKYGKGMGGPAYTTVSEALGMSGLNFKKNFIAQWNANEDNGYNKWENLRNMLAHPTIVSAARMTGLPLVQQLSKWAKIAERAEMNGEDIPPFNKILGSTYEREE